MENSDNLERRRFERASKKVRAISGFYKHLAVYLIVNGFLIALHYFDLDKGEAFLTFGTFSTAFFWGIGLLFHGLSVLGPNVFLGSDWEERKINEIMEREKSKKWQ